ncbi:MAG: peptidoglycan-binding protein, partial [Solirubrobacterales bacterium]|nr:peptidoglycan-binding protein [Solirubrobacterales bacterium]
MRRRRAVAAGVAAVLVGAAAAAVVLGGDDGPAGRPSTARGRTALVKRRNLVSRVTIDGQLGYADQRKVAARLAGTLTWLAPEGSVVAPGHSLYRLDDVRVLLLDGDRPAWRAFTPGMSDGRDVLALETNLSALGYDPYGAMTVDEDWTAATTAAVKRFQEHVGLDDTGTLELGRIVFLPGARRVSQHNLSIGDAAGPGGPVLTTTSTRRVVAANLSADDQGAAKRGDRVFVDLPDGSEVRGRITEVGAVATTSQDGGSTIDITVALGARGLPRL